MTGRAIQGNIPFKTDRIGPTEGDDTEVESRERNISLYCPTRGIAILVPIMIFIMFSATFLILHLGTHIRVNRLTTLILNNARVMPCYACQITLVGNTVLHIPPFCDKIFFYCMTACHNSILLVS